MKLNLGCGDKILDGFINVDKYPSDKRVKELDANKLPFPFKDNTFDYILAEHLLEHLDNPLDVLIELHRITKSNGKIKIHVPHFSHFTNHSDLTHNRDWSYFSIGEQWTNKPLYPLFNVIYKKLNFNRINHTWMNPFFNPLINFMPMVYERFFCYILPTSEIQFLLEVKK